MMAELLTTTALPIMLVGAMVGIASSAVGTFLVLRGNSMLSDAISHSIVFGIVIVWLLTKQQSGPVQLIGAVNRPAHRSLSEHQTGQAGYRYRPGLPGSVLYRRAAVEYLCQ